MCRNVFKITEASANACSVSTCLIRQSHFDARAASPLPAGANPLSEPASNRGSGFFVWIDF